MVSIGASCFYHVYCSSCSRDNGIIHVEETDDNYGQKFQTLCSVLRLICTEQFQYPCIFLSDPSEESSSRVNNIDHFISAAYDPFSSSAPFLVYGPLATTALRDFIVASSTTIYPCFPASGQQL